MELLPVVTSFYIAIPPQTFEKGFTVEIEDTEGYVMEQSTDKALTIERNHIQPMASFTFVNPNGEGDVEFLRFRDAEALGKSNENSPLIEDATINDIQAVDRDMDIKLNSIQEIYDYLSKHHKDIKANSFDEISYYEDHRDDYLDDPEDEIRFPPEIFETLDN